MTSEAMQLPNGEVTTSEERYVTAWRAFADRVADLLGGRRHSYDPGLMIFVGKEEVDLPQRAAERLHAVALELEVADRLVEIVRGARTVHDDSCASVDDIRTGEPCDCSLPYRNDAVVAWDRLRAAKERL